MNKSRNSSQPAGHIAIEGDAGVLVARLHGGPHALFDPEMAKQLNQLVDRAGRDPDIHAVVFTGTHPDRFLSHSDVHWLQKGGTGFPPINTRIAKLAARSARLINRLPGVRKLAGMTRLKSLLQLDSFHATFLKMNASGTIFIAALNGSALAVGAELAFACDLRIMADGDHVIGLTEVLLALTPGGGGSQRLPRLIGTQQTLLAVLEGRPFTPAEALSLGAVDELVPQEDVLARAIERAEYLSLCSKKSLGAIKRSCRCRECHPYPWPATSTVTPGLVRGEHPAVTVSFLYRAFCRVVQLIRLIGRSNTNLAIEVVMLRPEVAVLRRQVHRPALEPADRAVLAGLARLLPRRRLGQFFVQPETLLRWHRALVTKRWTYPHRRPGRPGIAKGTTALVLRLANENPAWGYRRVWAILKRHGVEPSPRRSGPTWAEFLTAQAKGRMACDFFHVDTVLLRRLYVLVFIHHDTRFIRITGVTAKPVSEWVAQQARNLSMELADHATAVKFLVRDRDTKYTASFDAVFAGDAVRVIRTPVQAPRANAICERVIGTIRRERLDRMLILGRRHLEALLVEYLEHYNAHRPHRSLDQRAPPALDATPALIGDVELARLRRTDRFGGLIHEYRIAA